MNNILGQRYEVIPSEEAGDGDYYHLDLGYLRGPVEVDEWHPASQPPKPEDFEPTGFIDIIRANRFAYIIRKNSQENYKGFTHWRKISPPK